MSWFKTPSEYRRYADGRVEIIERRSLLKISLAAIGSLALLGGTAAIVMNQSPMGPGGGVDGGFTRHPSLTKDIAAAILRRQDREAVYRIQAEYARLDVAERALFWNLALALEMEGLQPFAKVVAQSETSEVVSAGIETFLRAH